MIFVDTSAWYAYVDATDENHRKASDWYVKNAQDLFTTDYVVDEVLTLLRSRDENDRAIELGLRLFTSEFATLVYLTQQQIERAWFIFRKFADKEWSFTVCTSKIVIEDLGITTAFTFDHHFRPFGNITVVP
jgi:uncharacterized protein